MSASPFAAPGTASGISWEDLNGALLLIKPFGVEEGIKTKYGEKSAIRANIDVVDGDMAGTEYVDALVFGLVLHGQLRSRLGQQVLGRLGQGQAQNGQKPPWILTEATEADQQVAIAHLAGGLKTPAATPEPPF